MFFENHINNQCEKLLNGANIYGINFQGDGATIKDAPLLNPTCVSLNDCGLYRSHQRWSQEGC